MMIITQERLKELLSYDPLTGVFPWQSGISKDGKRMSLGHFSTKEEAHAAYIKAAERLFGEFARAA